VAVVAIWAKDTLDSKRISQSWFEEMYISNGIDRLLGYLRLQEVQLLVLRTYREAITTGGATFPNIENFAGDSSLSTFPLQALVRVETLLKTREYTAVITTLPEFTRFFNSLPAEKRSRAVLTEKMQLVAHAYNSLVEIREVLLGIKIKRKSQTHTVFQNQKVKEIVARFAEEAKRWNERVNERDKLISVGL
jgi:hypothetical protein